MGSNYSKDTRKASLISSVIEIVNGFNDDGLLRVIFAIPLLHLTQSIDIGGNVCR